jgi:hypothetical protein
MAKADRILALFPSVYGARDRTKLLDAVVRALAGPLEEADTLLFRIQRAHRINVAEQIDDIVKLAAVLGLTPFHFEDIVQDTSLPIAIKLDALRARVKRIAQLHLVGLGTPWAVLQAAAIFLNASIVAEKTGDPLIKHEDGEGYSHKAVLQFDTVEAKPREPIYLHEGLMSRHKIDSVERYPLASWTITNDSIEPAPMRIVIQGIGERTVMPSVFSSDTQEGIVFNGVVPDSSTLVVDAVEGATLDGHPVDDWITYFRGGIADFSSYGATYSTGRESTESPFDGDLDALSAPPYQARRPVPKARIGSSAWYFTVARGVYDGCCWDFAVCDVPQIPIGSCDGDFNYDQCVYDFDPSGIAGMAWDERVTCAFKLMLPSRIPTASKAPSGGGAQSVNHVGRIGTILPRFKAAGVRAYVDTAPDAWILGQSLLRDAGAANGEGIEFHSTIVRNPAMELLVPSVEQT